MNAYAAFARGFAERSDRPFLETEDGRVLTYGGLGDATARAASALAGLGLEPGDRVLAQVDKSPEALVLYLGALRAGLAYVPVNPAYTEAELRHFLDDARPRLAVCRSPAAGSFERLAAAGGGTTRVLTLDGDGRGSLPDLSGHAPARFPTVPARPDDIAVVAYTSGTTGRPKGAMVTHGNLTSNAEALAGLWRFAAEDVLLHALPLFHVHGLFVALHPVLLAGARILLHRRFDAGAVLRALPRATVLMGVPTFYTRLLAEPGLDRRACAGVRLFVSGSAPLAPDAFARFRERTGHAILERYGMSETGIIASSPYDGERRPGSVGFPLPGVSVRVVDGEGAPVGPGAPGEIQVRGPNVFRGYWGQPERRPEDFTADGWFRTGDVGSWDPDGALAIVGRAKDVVITGGYNVYPREVEQVLEAIDGVAEAAVVGLPHPDLGEAVVAAVVAAPGATLTESGVIARVRGRLAGYKVPRQVRFVERLPRNAMGKVDKPALRERLSARDSPAGRDG